MLDELVPLEPLHFFDLQLDVGQKLTPLPDLLHSHLAKVSMSWSFNGLNFLFDIETAFDEPHPRGDCVELFIDTRDLKSSTVTQFCHHFLIFPEVVDGESAREVTRFRSEERHPLAHPDLLSVKSSKVKGRRKMEIFIPKEALFGYDPSRIRRLGFNYRVQEASGDWQVLSVSAEDFPIEQHPLLWATINLEE